MSEVDAQLLGNATLLSLGEQMEAIGQTQLGACTARIVGLLTGQITDINILDHLLDDLLNAAHTADGAEVFRQVCRFLYPKHPRLVAEYVYAYRDVWGDDEIDQDESC